MRIAPNYFWVRSRLTTMQHIERDSVHVMRATGALRTVVAHDLVKLALEGRIAHAGPDAANAACAITHDNTLPHRDAHCLIKLLATLLRSTPHVESAARHAAPALKISTDRVFRCCTMTKISCRLIRRYPVNTSRWRAISLIARLRAVSAQAPPSGAFAVHGWKRMLSIDVDRTRRCAYKLHWISSDSLRVYAIGTSLTH